MKIIVKIIFLSLLVNITYGNAIEKMQYTLNLLKEGETYIQSGLYDDICLILGKTGTGKSTLGQLIAGNNSNLISKGINEDEDEDEDEDEFIIIDLNNKISNNSTIISKTLFPELIYDNETKVPYYDCPGFGDTRNSSIDIAANYFIHKVIDESKRIKAVFVVNHVGVREGISRNDFMQTLQHATSLFKNVDKFENSISLIATKVDNTNSNGKFQSDKKIINGIAKFLLNTKVSIEQEINGNPGEKLHFYKNAIKFIDIITAQNNGTYDKIGLFRRPDHAGPVSKIDLLQNNRLKLKQMIEYNLKYKEKISNDFGYTISAESLNDVHELIQQIKNLISEEISLVSGNIYNYFEEGEINLKDIQNFKEVANKQLMSFTVMYESMKLVNKSRDLITIISQYSDVESINKTMLNSNLENIMKYDKFLEFLYLVSSKVYKIEPEQLIRSLEKPLNYAQDLKYFYTFLFDLHIKLSDYNIQEDPSRFNVNNLKRNIDYLLLKDLKVKGSNIQSFVEGIYYKEILNGLVIPGFENIKNLHINDFKLRILYEVLDQALLHKMKFKCDSEALKVNGDYVKISDILSINCPDWKQLEVFAYTKIFVDQNIIKRGNNIKIVMIAPLWEIVNERQISLNGINGKVHLEKLTDFSLRGQTGSHGKDGEPGTSGGSFLAIGHRFLNGINLQVFSIGGNASSGQNGGRGGDGADGQTFDWKFIRDDKIITLAYNEIKTKYQKFGQNGYAGGNGGRGGNGAYGGLAGEISIHQFVKNYRFEIPNITSINGADGRPGYGGRGGSGGRGGENCVKINTVRTIAFGVVIENSDEIEPCWRNDGKNGITGSNGRLDNSQKPIAKKTIPNKAAILDKFMTFIFLRTSNRISRSLALKFFNELSTLKLK